MNRVHKWIIYIIILLAIMSIYLDLSDGSPVSPRNVHKPQTERMETRQFTVVKVKVEPGETFLSITEQLNDTLTTLDIEKISRDFKLINDINPQDIEDGATYSFPLYK